MSKESTKTSNDKLVDKKPKRTTVSTQLERDLKAAILFANKVGAKYYV